MTPEQAATAAERFACPTCGSPAGSPCRTPSGNTAFRYHTARFILVNELSGAPEVLVPDDREPGRPWQAPTAPAPPEHPAGTPVRIGYACGTPAAPELQGQLDALRAALLLDMAKAGGLPWDLILGADVSKAYKPTMEAYLRPAAMLGLEPGEIMLAAAHETDLAAARKAGLAAAFISRPLEQGPGIPGAGVATESWDLSVSSITELANLM